MRRNETIRITTGKEADRALESLGNMPVVVRRSIRRALYEIGGDSERDLRAELGGRFRSGRRYSFRGRLHQASAKGEFPARRSGRLARSTDYHVRGAYELEVGVKTGRAYPEELEFGNRGIGARPFIKPTAERHAKIFASLLRAFTKASIKRKESK